MKVYIEFLQGDRMVRKIFYNVVTIVKKSKSYIYIYERVNNNLEKYEFPLKKCIYNVYRLRRKS